MEIKEITELIDAVSKAEINNFHLQKGDFCLTMDKLESHVVAGVPLRQNEPVVQEERGSLEEPTVLRQEEEVSAKEVANTISKQANCAYVNSPIVGTFYSAAGPKEEDLVKVGDHVKKGQVLCIIEAMKLMNEIEAEIDGEIVQIFVKNDEMVEYNQPLFAIQP